MIFPSPEFDEAVAALCHGRADEAQHRELTRLLESTAAARDEYLLRVELHARLASDGALFITANLAGAKIIRLPEASRRWKYAAAITALAACLVALAILLPKPERGSRPVELASGSQPPVALTNAVAREADPGEVLALNLRLESLQARLAASEDWLRRLERARESQETTTQ